ncbi:MAG: hypothetical protein Q9166_006426 [cf. Caloplaca sp. 2 TL-2023]
MRFGRDYHKHQIAEWADAYMNYAALKRACKEPTASTNVPVYNSDPVECLELAARCTGAIHTIDQFYRDTYTMLLLKSTSNDRLQDPYHDVHARFTAHLENSRLDYVELQHQKAALLVLVADYDKLRWYGRVNTDGFRKIICKIRSLGTNGIHIAIHVEQTLCSSEFTTQAHCVAVLEKLHKIIIMITRAQQSLLKEPWKVRDSFCVRLAMVHPSIPALALFRLVENDDYLEFGRLIDNICQGDLGFSRTEFFRVLFRCSIRCSSHLWVDVLISRSISQDAVAVIESCLRDIIVELCWSASKAQQATPYSYRTSLAQLTYMLDRLQAEKLDLLYKQDRFGRIPLHYACEYDSAEVCGVILKSMKAWEKLNAGDAESAILLKDMQSRSPIQIAVLSGHLEVLETLIHFHNRKHRCDHAALRPCFSAACSELLLLAIRSCSTEAAACLLDLDVDVNCSDALGQTALYLAARSGNEIFIRLLLRHKPVVDRPETTKNWTPLIIASLSGFTTIAETLLGHGANVEHRDQAGWTAIDHASYRGHISLAKALSKTAADLSHKQAAALQHQLKESPNRRLPTRGQPRRNVSPMESYVVVNLGSLDSPNPTPAVYLSPHMIENPFTIHPESLFSLEVSMAGTTNPTYSTTLPVLEDATNKPWIFSTIGSFDAKLVFEVFRNELANTECRELVGRGITLLDSYKQSQTTKRESLSRDFTVPILSTVGLEYIGAVNFRFVISTPLVLPDTPLINTEALWSENGPSKVVGHRGDLVACDPFSSLI